MLTQTLSKNARSLLRKSLLGLGLLVVLITNPIFVVAQEVQKPSLENDIKDAIFSYVFCVKSEAILFSSSDESPENIAIAATSKCTSEKSTLHALSLKRAYGGYAENSPMIIDNGPRLRAIVDSSVAETESTAKNWVITYILEQRMKAQDPKKNGMPYMVYQKDINEKLAKYVLCIGEKTKETILNAESIRSALQDSSQLCLSEKSSLKESFISMIKETGDFSETAVSDQQLDNMAETETNRLEKDIIDDWEKEFLLEPKKQVGTQ